MKFGDLSNELAPGLGFRFERVLKTKEGKLNRAAKAYIESVGRLDVNVYIITTGDERKARLFLYKWGVVYYRLIQADSLLEIPDICNENKLLTYYDTDVNVLQNVRARGRERVEAKLWTAQEVS